MGPPMSFMMMGQEPSSNPSDNNMVGVSLEGNGMLPINLPSNVGNSMDPFATMTASTPAPIIVNNLQPTVAPPSSATATTTSTSTFNQSAPAPMMLPSMTMIFQSEPGGNSAIELNMLGSSSMANSTSAALLQRPANNKNKWIPQQQQLQQQQDDQFDEPAEPNQQTLGEQYYSSPWTNRAPLASPAKVFRGERLRIQQQQPRTLVTTQTSARQQQVPPSQQTSVVVGQMASSSSSSSSNQAHTPILLIKNQRWPSQQSGNLNLPVAVLQHQQQQAVNQALEYEELVPIGPPQMMPVYQTANGQIHMSPPPPVMIQAAQVPPRTEQPTQSPNSAAQFEREEGSSGKVVDLNSEVNTANNVVPTEPTIEPQRTGRQQLGSKTSNNKIISPSVKGKQQQKTNQKSVSSGGY